MCACACACACARARARARVRVCVDVNTAVPLVDQPDEAEVLATRPMSYVLAVDNGIYHTPRVCLSVCYMTQCLMSVSRG